MNHEIPLLLRYEDLQKFFKVSRSSLARWEAKSKFPKRIYIGRNSIRWRSDEVQKWLEERSKTRDSSLI